MCCLLGIGRESLEWDGQESVVWQAPTSQGKKPSRGKARCRVDKVIVVVVVVVVVVESYFFEINNY